MSSRVALSPQREHIPRTLIRIVDDSRRRPAEDLNAHNGYIDTGILRAAGVKHLSLLSLSRPP